MAGTRLWSKLHVYQRVVIVFTLLIIPVYLVSLWINTVGLRYIRHQFATSIDSNVNFYAEQLDGQMAFIRNQQLQFGSNSDLQRLSFLSTTLDPYEQVRLAGQVAERLTTIQNSSEYVLNAGVYVKSFGRVISTRDGVTQPERTDWPLIEQLLAQQPHISMYASDGRLFFIEAMNRGAIVSYIELSKTKLEATLYLPIQNERRSGTLLMDDAKPPQRISPRMDEQVVTALFGMEPKSGVIQVGNTRYQVITKRISSLGWTLGAYYDQDEVTGPLKLFLLGLVALSIVSVGVILLFAFSVNWMIHRPLNKLIRSFELVETDNLHLAIQTKRDNEFLYLYRSFEVMVAKLDRSIQQNYEQKLALRQAELKQLQSQINPHFLYNGFYNIYRLSKTGDLDNVSFLAQKLGSYYQFITRSGTGLVPLQLEYRHAMDYCDIQRVRFSNRMRVEAVGLPDRFKALPVPKLIIQPIVENAFEHAFESQEQGGVLYITITAAERELRIAVEDDGESMTDERLQELRRQLADTVHSGETTGILNVCRRLRLHFGEASGVFASRSRYGGLKAELVIMHTEEGNHVQNVDR
ncbi:histidine kinase [Paenibacillus sp. HJGM_3]|uniref:sensor histidine kinase n=1 Tax=Paenibacillus sp. HJGM_3 TaxID=3379816 RepID=UPI00385D5CDB